MGPTFRGGVWRGSFFPSPARQGVWGSIDAQPVGFGVAANQFSEFVWQLEK